MKNTVTQYLFFNKLPSNGKKTETFEVLPKESHGNLGTIKWYANWRKYVFFPNSNCLFDDSCLRDIADFIKGMMEERKELRATEKEKKEFKKLNPHVPHL